MILFENDWKRYPNAIADTDTSNKSFLRLSLVLKSMGVKNHAFPLALLNPELKGVNPHSTNLTVEQMLLIAQECYNNFWYFIREVVRIPTDGGDAVPFQANRGNVATYYSYFNHSLTALLMPRQCGKSIALDVLSTYLLNIRLKNSKIILLTKDDTLRSANLERLKDMIGELPFYLKQNSKRDISNTEEITVKSLGNNIIGLLPSKSQKQALNLGRGHTSANVFIDEIAFLYNIRISLPALLAATTAARDSAKKINSPYGTIVATTAGKKDDVDGKFAYDLFYGSTVWDERLYDCLNEEDYRDVVTSNNSTGLFRVNCSFSHRQIGKTDQWLVEKMKENASTGADAERDYLCKWTSGSVSSPISPKDADRIRASQKDPIYTQIVKRYLIRWYIDENEIEKYMSEETILSLDTSDASGGDEISLVLLSVGSGKVLAVSNYNETNLIEFSNYILEHFIKRYPKLVCIIERKSSGSTIIDYLLLYMYECGINPFARMFNLVVNNYEEMVDRWKEIERGRVSYETIIKYKKFFGFATSAGGLASRSDLYGETLNNCIKNVGEMIFDKKLIDQLLSLEIRNNRVDHPEGGHDDMVIGLLLGYFFLSKAKNHAYYGIRNGLALSKISRKIVSSKDYYVEGLKREVNQVYNELVDEVDEFVIMKLEAVLKRKMEELSLVSDEQIITYEGLRSRLENDRKIRK